jgi:hypothetical protein
MSEENKVAKMKEQGIVTFDESLFEQDQGVGLENMGQEDLALPFLKVLSRQDPTLDTIDAKAETYITPSQENGTKVVRALKLFLVLINVVFLSGCPAEAVRVPPKTSTLRLTSDQKLSAVQMTIAIMWLAVRAAIWRKHTNILC